MIAKLVLRFLVVVVVLGAGTLSGLRVFAPDELAAVSPRLVPVRHQVNDLLTEIGRDREAGGIRPATMAKGQDLALAHPLDPLPYTLVQFEEADQGDWEMANRAALTALSFQPRNRAARMHVVNQLVAGGAYDEALSQISLLTRIDRDGQETYHTAILRLVQNRAAWPAIERAVAADPPWKERMLVILARSSVDSGFLQRLFVHWPERIDVLLNRYIRDGDLDTAYLTFLSNLPADTAIAVPFDASLEGLPGPQPFNWRVNSRYAEMVEEGGLEISYFGRGKPSLLEQVFPLSPGAYRLDAAFDGTFNPEAANFGFRFRCAKGAERGPRLVEWRIPSEDILTGRTSHVFVHDGEDCDYVRLQFEALPGLFPATTRLMLTGLDITSVDTDAS